MRNFSVSPKKILASLWCNRDLIIASVKREVLGRYRGSVMGIMWSFINPMFMLAVYTVVFSVVFKARWGGGNDSKTEFAMVLFAGLIIFNLFSECINRAPSLVLSNVNYVKKILFPLEVLPVITLFSAVFHFLISLSVWFLAYAFFFGLPHATVFLLPLIIMPFLIFITGVTWILASLGVYLRDISQVIGVVTSVLMFLSPIFYPISALPEAYRQFLYFNPLTPVIEMVRDVLYWGRIPSFSLLGVYWIVGLSVAWFGFFCFQKMRKGFADVL
ncbi:ABC transporter permease [Serratia microhaemolytica]|uniref:ABC transporter permease n=1 Tax=Serratia microhaemolytica TaxID=2675110 RepID=UPI000FDED8D7|nr:ABC transporter permease [Serratia microhaemolytica]